MNFLPGWFLRPFFLLAAVWLLAPVRAQNPGTLDAAFAPGTLSGGAVVSAFSGGRVVISGGGLFQITPTVGQRPAIRLLGNGAPDPTFDLKAQPSEVNGHAVAVDGHLLLYGRFEGFNGHPTRYVVRLNEDGSNDTTFKFDPPTTEEAVAVLPLPDGGAYIVRAQGRIVRVLASGAIDPGFALDPASSTQRAAAALQPSGKLVVVQNGAIYRLDTAGKRDLTYTETLFPNVVADQRHLAVTPEGGVYVTSDTQKVNGGALRTIVRLLPDGGVDPAFQFANDGTVAGSRSVTAMVLQPDGHLVLQGGGMTPTGLFRVTTSGALDAAFGLYTSGVSILGVEPSGKILALGTYIQITPAVLIRSGSLLRLWSELVEFPPVITAAPISLTVKSGQPATFGVSSSGTEPLTYQWQFNDVDITGATERLLTVAASRATNAGNYRVRVQNAKGSVVSPPAVLTVDSAPYVIAEPVGFAAMSGTAGSLSAAAGGEAPIALQWYQDGLLLSGATAGTLTFPSLVPTNAGAYQLVASNAFGMATSAVARVTVYARQPNWLVLTNATTQNVFSNADNPFRPDFALKVVPGGIRGPVVLYAKGVERWNDAGERLWSARYVEADFGALNSVVVDTNGNVYVAGILHFTGALGDLPMTNNSAVSGPNGHKQAFIAKLDPDGHGLWYRLFEAAGPVIASLAVADDGDVVFVGNNGGKVGRSYLGSLSVFEDAYMAAIAGRIGPDGTPRWLKSFTQFTVNRSTCEADTIVADASGLYLSGLISFSIQFGTLQLQSTGGWIGKLSNAGEALWIKANSGTGGQGDPMALRGGQLWKLFTRTRSLEHWSRDGVLLSTVNAASSVSGDNATLTGLGLNADGELLLVGNAVGATRVGSVTLDTGVNRKWVWLGRWATNGDFISARVLATTTNASAVDSVRLNSFGVAETGDLYAVGSFANALRFLGVNHTVPVKGYAGDFSAAAGWLAKVSAAALQAPEITQQPIASAAMQTGDSLRLAVKATGPGVLAYQWRHDGTNVPGATADFLQFTAMTMADSGVWDCVVSNAFGSATTEPSVIVVAPPYRVTGHPVSQLIILGGATLAGAGIDTVAIVPSALVGKQLSFVITNTTSARFPMGGAFTASFNGGPVNGAYVLPGTGVLGAHQNTWFLSARIPELTSFFLNQFVGINSATLALKLGGGFDLHYDIPDADGCCAAGTFTLTGGAGSANFRVTTSPGVPAGNYQWQKDGVDLPGQTTAAFSLPVVTLADAGTYRCVVRYQGYESITENAVLRVVTGAVPPPPVLSYAPFIVGDAGLTIPSWPAGFVLQRTASLSGGVWVTLATTPPVTIPLSAPGEFFRLVPGP